MRRIITIKDAHAIAKLRGGKCLSKTYVRKIDKLKWECQYGHIWKASLDSLENSGSWCPECGGTKKLSIEVFKKIAKSHGGKCLSKSYSNSSTKMLWQCSKGHKWEASGKSIKLSKSWCPNCAGNKKYTLHEIKQIAKRRDGMLLSVKYINSDLPLNWQCKFGHKWSSRLENINSGHWCPTCGGSQKLSIKDFQDIAKEKGGLCLSKRYKNNQSVLKFECKNGHQWKAVAMNIRNGSWCPLCSHQNPRYSIQEMKDIAKAREGKCLSKKYINSISPLKWCCSKGHHWSARPANVIQGQWCPECSGTKKKTIEDMHKLAKKRGWQCLSTKYVNNNTKLRWRCEKQHEFEMIPSNVQNGRNCRYCSRCTLTIEEMQHRAAIKGGKCLSKKYKGVNVHLLWKCAFGHQWKTQPKHIISGSWCPECARTKGKKEYEVLYNSILKEARNKTQGSLRKEAYKLKKLLEKRSILIKVT